MCHNFCLYRNSWAKFYGDDGYIKVSTSQPLLLEHRAEQQRPHMTQPGVTQNAFLLLPYCRLKEGPATAESARLLWWLLCLISMWLLAWHSDVCRRCDPGHDAALLPVLSSHEMRRSRRVMGCQFEPGNICLCLRSFSSIRVHTNTITCLKTACELKRKAGITQQRHLCCRNGVIQLFDE